MRGYGTIGKHDFFPRPPSFTERGFFFLAKIAFLLQNDELVSWIQSEAKAFPFEELFGADKPADAYVVLADGDGQVDEFRSMVEGHLFAWFGDGVDQIKDLNPFSFEGDWQKFDAETLMTVANEMHEQIEEERRKQKEAEKPARPSLRPQLIRRRTEMEDEYQAANENSEYVAAFEEESQVIAVGGDGGASFVAWNLAAITHLPLIEGRQTGSLARWTGDATPIERAIEETLPYGTVANHIPPKSILKKRVIVDCGPDSQHPVFVHAKIRIWVTTLDPAQPPIPERTRVVVNRVPSHLPFDPREVVKADIALMVPDGGLDALLSLYTHVAWITKQGREVQEAWRALVKAKEPEANQRTVDELGADDTW